MKKIKTVTLLNQALDEREQYRVMTIGEDILNDSKKAGGSDALKELLRESINDLCNGDVQECIGDHVTDEDVDYCIDELAKGHASNIAGEDFWWSDAEEVVTSLTD